jgi:hypothetical protein
MTQTFTIESDNSEREVTDSNDDGDVFTQIEITGKEGIDVIHALDELTTAVKNGRFDTDLPVEEMRDMTRGGLRFPDDCSILIPSQQHARALIHAFNKFEPEGPHFIDRVHEDVLTALEESSIGFDVDTLRAIQ